MTLRRRDGMPADPRPATGEGLGRRKSPRRLVENEDRGEACVLFAALAPGDAVQDLTELRSLATTLDLAVVGELVQNRRSPDPRTYLGAGKVDELAQLVASTGATLAVCDADLSPTQERNLEKRVSCRVIDRTELILDIFHTHARTRQAQLQVELAQLQYALPRLRRLWTHLERQRGGRGAMGGAGEKQIRVDRTLIRDAISRLREELTGIERRRQREIAGRANAFTISLVGYTNAGKSCLMNRLTGAGVLSEDRLFSTLDTRTRVWSVGQGRDVLLSDTVGFIRGLPHHLVSSFHATLEEAIHADLLLHVVDASHPEALEQVRTVERVLADIGAQDRPTVLVLNKIDRVADLLTIEPLRAHDPQSVLVSARTGQGAEALAAWVAERADASADVSWVAIPITRTKLVAQLRNAATILEERFETERVLIRIRARKPVLDELLAKGATAISAPEARDGSPS